MEKTVISREEAFKKGYLQHKKVYLRAVPRGGKMIKDKSHVAFFQIEGGNNWFQLAADKIKGGLINPFSSDEEKTFFEHELDLNLSIHGTGSFWNKFLVKVVKDYNLMNKGYEFDLSDPMDVLRVKVLKTQSSIAPNWDVAYSKPEYRLAIVEEGYEEEKKATQSSALVEAYTYFGSIQSSTPKMTDFLGLYFNETKQMKLVPADADKSWLQTEITNLIQTDIDTVLKIIHDKNASIKLDILNAVRVGAIDKEARNKFNLKGEGVSYTYLELVDYLQKAKEVKSDVYLKLIAQIDLGK